LARRASDATVDIRIANHSFRATEISAYLKNGGSPKNAVSMANRASTGTTQLSGHRADEVTLDEVERVWI
jgi:hypothetical protein